MVGRVELVYCGGWLGIFVGIYMIMNLLDFQSPAW